MKVVLFLVALGVCIAFSEAGICQGNDDCEEDECCFQVAGLIHKCKPRKKDGEKCMVKDMTVPFKKEVYKIMCPCLEGLSCVKGDNLVGKMVGKCESDEDIIPNKVKTEAPAE